MGIFDTIGMAWVIFTALIGNALLIYLAWMGVQAVQKERERGTEVTQPPDTL